jgi:VanZ family protein
MIKRFLLTPWPLLLWTVMIFFLLTINTGSMESAPKIKHFDKLVHFILFAVMAWLWVHPRHQTGTIKLLFIFLCVTAYGAGMEWVQENFTSREFDWKDIYADTAGAAAGVIVGKKIGPYGNRGRNQN